MDEIEEELAAIMADPEFRAELLETVERIRRGEEPLVEHAEVVRRLRRGPGSGGGGGG